jgi:8-oxo-dGTP pyrophosphatase MutT (NUDIX family)
MKNIYASLGRAAHSLATPFLRRYFKNTTRVRTLVLNEKQEVLLVRSWFGHQRWSLPGGGIGRRESPITAAIREVFEETGIHIQPDHIKPLGTFANGDSSAPFTVDGYIANIPDQPAHITPLRRLELLDAAWFSLRAIPAERSSTVDRALGLLPR